MKTKPEGKPAKKAAPKKPRAQKSPDTPVIAPKRPLRPKHREFADKLLADPTMNATRAYMATYLNCGEEAARRNAARLMTRADIAKYIDAEVQARSQRTLIDKDYVIEGLLEVSKRCMQKNPVFIGRGKDRERATEFVTDPESGKEVLAHVFEFDSSGANRALELLGKHLGIFKENTGEDDAPPIQKVEITIKDGRKV